MNLNRRYIQFNDLVIDSFDMLDSADRSGGFKTQTQGYSGEHGSYAPFPSNGQYAEEQELSLTLKFYTKSISCDQVKHYRNFVQINLNRPGRIWALQGEDLLWAYAFVQGIGDPYELERGVFSQDVDVVIYEGLWHRADPFKTFVQPYDLCNYLECEDFRDLDHCKDECCICGAKTENTTCTSCMCECEALQEEYSLCYMRRQLVEELNKFCGSSFKITYNCEVGEEMFGEKALGHRFCKEEPCKGIIAGLLYSDTILPTDKITITVEGVVKDPIITINDNSLQIMGEYDGKLIIAPSGDVYYKRECCEDIQVDINNLVIPHGSTFKSKIHFGNNSIIIETHNCCDMACAYIKVDSITN